MKIAFKPYINEELERFIAAGIKNTEYYKHKLDVYMGTGIIMLVLAFALGFLSIIPSPFDTVCLGVLSLGAVISFALKMRYEKMAPVTAIDRLKTHIKNESVYTLEEDSLTVETGSRIHYRLTDLSYRSYQSCFEIFLCGRDYFVYIDKASLSQEEILWLNSKCK